MVGVADKKRLDDMAILANSGWTLKKIGEKYSITEQAVYYLFKKWSIRIERPKKETKMQAKQAEREILSMRLHGLSTDELKKFRQSGVTKAYLQHKKNAARRGISWEFNLATWSKVWMESGRLNDRGNTNGKFVMARFGDLGPYSESNVEIITINQNSYDARINSRAP